MDDMLECDDDTASRRECDIVALFILAINALAANLFPAYQSILHHPQFINPQLNSSCLQRRFFTKKSSLQRFFLHTKILSVGHLVSVSCHWYSK